MTRRTAEYLRKRGVAGPWRLEGGTAVLAPGGVPLTVVIPALAENPALFDTLADLRDNSPESLDRTQVIVVVNNRPPEACGAAEHGNNQATLARLRAGDGRGPYHLAWVDAASPGLELPKGQGVGLARKIGMDLGLASLPERGAEGAVIACLDADTRAAPGYLDALSAYFAAPGRWAAWCAFAHPLGENNPAITAYELHLRCYELGLRRAGSPYAFPAVGSTMACTAEAYAAVGGMGRRLAGEDFYFLQQLAKTRPVGRVPGAMLHPSARASLRVPFGTGAKVARWTARPEEVLTYHPDSYRVLHAWLALAESLMDASPEAWPAAARSVDPALPPFLERQRFMPSWENIAGQAKTPALRRRRFHEWFDGFRTLKLIHHLRDAGRGDLPVTEAAETLAQWTGVPVPHGGGAESLLHSFREASDRFTGLLGLPAFTESCTRR